MVNLSHSVFANAIKLTMSLESSDIVNIKCEPEFDWISAEYSQAQSATTDAVSGKISCTNNTARIKQTEDAKNSLRRGHHEYIRNDRTNEETGTYQAGGCAYENVLPDATDDSSNEEDIGDESGNDNNEEGGCESESNEGWDADNGQKHQQASGESADLSKDVESNKKPKRRELVGKLYTVVPELDRPFCCLLCDKVYKTRSGLMEHIPSHSDELPHQCQQCGRHFKSKSSLRAHLRSHSEVRPFPCLQCGKQFKTSSAVKAHLRDVHGENKDVPQSEEVTASFPCPECGRLFSRSSGMRVHLRHAHSDMKPFSCFQCGKPFKSKNAIRVHLKTVHSEDRPFPCPKCGKTFKTRDKLRVHLLHTHSDAKPFHCSRCGKTFKTSDALRAHMRIIHSREREASFRVEEISAMPTTEAGKNCLHITAEIVPKGSCVGEMIC